MHETLFSISTTYSFDKSVGADLFKSLLMTYLNVTKAKADRGLKLREK
jgi:hypothetical protein